MAQKFDRSYVTGELERIGSELGSRVKVFLLGGCSMSFRGLKEATKDVDMVLTSPGELRQVAGSLRSLGYSEVVELPEEYEQLGASAVLRNSDGFQVDLFHRQVCRALEVSKGMEERAEFFGRFGNLEVYLVAPEDTFLFKGITERQADLVDMRVLAERGLDWETVKEECISQEKRRIWELSLVDRLEELRKKYGIESPIEKDLWETGGDRLMERVFTDILGQGSDTTARIAEVVREKYGYSESWTRKRLRELVDRGILGVGRTGRKYRYYLR